MKKTIILIISHLAFAAFGFAIGIFTLPILTAPDAPSQNEMTTATAQAKYTGEFTRNLQDSDFLHWGEGTISIGQEFIAFKGSLAPGPDYNLYLSNKFIETEPEFMQLKSSMAKVGPVKSFGDFIIPVPSSINPSDYNSVIVWCETFGEFITAAKYK